MARCASDLCMRWRPDVLLGLSGVTVDSRWFCSYLCVERMAQCLLSDATLSDSAPSTSVPRRRIGALLRHHGLVSDEQLCQALEQQQTSGLRLGAQVRALFGVDAGLILKALAAQTASRYVTSIAPAMVHLGPGGLPREAIGALGLIPFSRPDGQGVVRVASRAPMRWDAVSALRRLAGWNPEPYLVQDEVWDELFSQYGAGLASGDSASPAQHAVVLSDSKQAATHIATHITAAKHARITEAHWETHSWVRIHRTDSVQDVLFARHSPQEQQWQAVSTSR